MISICLILFFMNCFHLMTFDLNLLFANYSLTVEIIIHCTVYYAVQDHSYASLCDSSVKEQLFTDRIWQAT